jgi:hypothetical protein
MVRKLISLLKVTQKTPKMSNDLTPSWLSCQPSVWKLLPPQLTPAQMSSLRPKQAQLKRPGRSKATAVQKQTAQLKKLRAKKFALAPVSVKDPSITNPQTKRNVVVLRNLPERHLNDLLKRLPVDDPKQLPNTKAQRHCNPKQHKTVTRSSVKSGVVAQARAVARSRASTESKSGKGTFRLSSSSVVPGCYTDLVTPTTKVLSSLCASVLGMTTSSLTATSRGTEAFLSAIPINVT